MLPDSVVCKGPLDLSGLPTLKGSVAAFTTNATGIQKLNFSGSTSVDGLMSCDQFVLLLEGKADYFKTCGITLEMPSEDVIQQAPLDQIDRLRAIQEVNLQGMSNLTGSVATFFSATGIKQFNLAGTNINGRWSMSNLELLST